MADTASSTQLDRATWLARRHRWRRAGRVIRPALSDQPNDPRTLALNATIDAALKRIPINDALAILDDLAARNPDNPRLRVMAASLLARGGRVDEATSRLRSMTSESEDVPTAYETLANCLGMKRATWPEAWILYKRALQSGPLSSPCMKASAYYLGKREEPGAAQMALRDTSGLELLIVKTRSLGRLPLFAVFAILGLAGVVLELAYGFGLVLIPLILASAWGGWAFFASYYAGCRVCLQCWLFLIALLWAVAVVGIYSRFVAGSMVVGGAIGLLIRIGQDRALAPKVRSG